MYWGVFFAIALFDLKEHRIPNALLLCLIATRMVELLLVSDIPMALDSLRIGAILFLVGLGLYLVKAMSPGDVKLFFVVGFVTGIPNVGNLLYWVVLAGGLVAFFYFAYSVANDQNRKTLTIRNKNALPKSLGKENPNCKTQSKSMPTSRYGNKLVMPFAPTIVIGMAMFYYFN
nr:A24 family peptidase [Vibrio breoganii]